ncbi:molybdenum cofactor guanylyltransferase MobA [Allorhizobium borbori]|uniref:molybdenum cofactor guanylyltransferase MobA n=1 Tax=Allorhizobium borbori TaxID=485907 RepID=UPI00161858B5|nr:molybdenum cofactor guanylyltransferase MobA [Allorhizobium borbori]
MRVLGVVLAGGLASRLGGVDKASVGFGAGTLLDAVLARFAPQVEALVVNANGDASRFARYALPVVPDDIGGHPGPLAGILSAMDHGAKNGFSHVASVPVDTPFLPGNLVARLKDTAARGGAPIIFAASSAEDGRLLRQPVFGLWPVSLREDLRSSLSTGLSKIVLWADRHGSESVPFPSTDIDPFFNVNSAADLDEAQKLNDSAMY